MDEGDAAPERPIGWWVKEVDRLLDAAFDDALAGTGVDRRSWQVLASLARRGPAPHADVVASLRSFDPAAHLEAVVDGLVARGWVEESSGDLGLTPSGVEQQRTLAPRVGVVRERVSSALPAADYQDLVALLARLVDALR